MIIQETRLRPFALHVAERTVNQTLDVMGQYNAKQAIFDFRSLGHG